MKDFGNFTPHHIVAPSESFQSSQPGGRIVFVPGSQARAKTIAESFLQLQTFSSSRGHDVHIGVVESGGNTIDVAAVSTGMGCPSLDIVVTELIAIGARRLIRIGTAGSLQPNKVKPGHVVIATGAVRDEGSSLAYAPVEVPAVASNELAAALRSAAERAGLAPYTHCGIVHTKDSLYAREFGYGPLAAANMEYLLALQSCGVLASEMEAAHLFILAQCLQVAVGQRIHAGCVLAIVGERDHFAKGDIADKAIERALAVGLSSIDLVSQSVVD